MEVLKTVAEWPVDKDKHPRLWKAQIAFLSAEMLRNKQHLDCAANRYYYSLLNLAYHFCGEQNHTGGRWQHGDLSAEYVRSVDGGATEAFSRALGVRDKGDYTKLSVTPREIGFVVKPVADAIHRGLTKVSERERHDVT